MKNPFIYGRIVGREHFADREREVEMVKNAVLSGQSVIIYAYRRYGKSSLVYNAVSELPNPVLWIDCYGVVTKRELAEVIAKEVLKHWKAKNLLSAIKNLFRTVRPKLRVGEDLEIEFSVDEEEVAFEEALELPQRLAEQVKKRAIVVMDEFQEVVELGEDVLPKMRSAFQKHEDVSYIFVGSKKGMMSKIFRSPSSPFYNFGTHITLGRIPREMFFEFVFRKFRETGIDVDKEAVEQILDVTECHPYYTQMLCHHLWFYAYAGEKRLSPEDVKAVTQELVVSEGEAYSHLWDELPISQKRLLVALAKGVEDLYSAEFMRENGFKRASNVQAALRGLVNKGIVEKEGDSYVIADPFLKLWLRLAA